MDKKKVSLEFINKGKPFIVPKWTVKKHKAALARMNDECKGMPEEDKTDEFNYYVIYETLKQVDSSVSIDDIKELHPEDLITLFNVVYNAGKVGIFFREDTKKKGKKEE
jgi:hypothetical protein